MQESKIQENSKVNMKEKRKILEKAVNGVELKALNLSNKCFKEH